LKWKEEAGKNTSRNVGVAAGVSMDAEINLQIAELQQKVQKQP